MNVNVMSLKSIPRIGYDPLTLHKWFYVRIMRSDADMKFMLMNMLTLIRIQHDLIENAAMLLFCTTRLCEPSRGSEIRPQGRPAFSNRFAGQSQLFSQQFFTARRMNIAVLIVVLMGSRLIAQESNPSNGMKGGAKTKKYVNKIPYDVFFDNPLQIVSDNKGSVTQPTSVPEKTAEKTNESKPTEKPAEVASTSGASGWDSLIPIDELQSELKAVRNSLTKSISNQSQFNQNFKQIAIDGAELAALAGIVQEHSESTPWKDKAKYVRDFGAQINQSAVNMGKDNFEKTKLAYQKLTSVFDGSIPPDAGDVPATRPFFESASRKGLMRRMEKAKDWLKQDVNSEAKFKSMSDKIIHEASIVSALGTVVTKPGYDYTENDDYQGFAKTLIDGAKEASAAVKEESFEKFKQSIDKLNKSCTDCHGTYGT